MFKITKKSQKESFESYHDRLWDLCTDVGIGAPDEGAPIVFKKLYEKEVACDYENFARWLYKNNFQVDEEIEFFNNKYLGGKNMREAYYQVLNYKYCDWVGATHQV